VTPTPVIARAILVHNRGRQQPLADGIVITRSHDRLEDGGLKCNASNGGPADVDVTEWIQEQDCPEIGGSCHPGEHLIWICERLKSVAGP
jgi:phosphoglucomutase